MKNTIPNINVVTQLQFLFGQLWDEEFRPRDKSKIPSFKEKLDEIGIDSKLSPREIELKLQQLYELLTKTPKFANANKPNDMPQKTTWNKEESKQFQEEARIRNEQIAKTRENAKIEVERAQEKLRQIYDEQKRVQEQINKINDLQKNIDKIDPIYVKIEEEPKLELTAEELNVIEGYKKEIGKDPEQAEIVFARELHKKVDRILASEGLPQEEIDLVVEQSAERIVKELNTPKEEGYVPITTHLVINNAVYEHIQKSPKLTQHKQTQEELLTSIETTTKYRFIPEDFLREVVSVGLSKDIAEIVFGPDPKKIKNIKVIVSDTPIPGSQKYNFEELNKQSLHILREQNEIFTKFIQITKQESGGYKAISSSPGYVYLGDWKEKSQTVEEVKAHAQNEAKKYLFNRLGYTFPQTKVGQFLLKPGSQAEMLFYSTFTGAGKTVTWTGTGKIGGLIAKSETAARFVNLMTGTKYVTPVITQATTKVAGQVIVGKAAGQVATEVVIGTATKTGLAATLSTAFAALGSWATPIGMAISAAVGWVVGKVLEKINWPKIKKWFSENGWIFGVGAGLGGAMLFGAGPGLGIGLVVAGATVGFGTLATAAFGVLGVIGRSIGIAIATPVIITLLIIPPLVAFIMLVINNSAYVVPPAPSTLNNVVSPYIEVIKTPVPPGPFQNSELPLTVEYTITIRAKKSPLTNIRIDYECNVVIDGPAIPCPNPDPDIPKPGDSGYPTSISPTSSYSFSYKQEYLKGKFEDTLVSDTITVTADTPEEKNIKSSGSAGIKIGNPPDTCPSIWPVNGGPWRVTQTSGGSYSHSSIEAIDIATHTGVVVVATHSGTANVVYTTNAYRPLYIDITSNCAGKDVTTRYAHLSGSSITTGQQVVLGQPIGISGSDGSGPHLHYEFRGLKMEVPYIPKNLPRNCSGNQCALIP